MTSTKDFDRWMAQAKEIDALQAENIRLREQAEVLAAVVKLARNGHHWCNDADQSANGMAVLCSRVKDIADKADAALRAYREAGQ